MSLFRGRWSRLVLLVLGLAAVGVAAAPSASAHPLGNFTVNYSSTLVVEPTAVRIDHVVDRAEIPTLQAFADARPGQDPVGAAEFRGAECAAVAAGSRLDLGGQPVSLQVTATRLTLLPGAAGLATSRLECTLRTTGRVRTVGRTLTFAAPSTQGRVGWHEVIARGDGVTLAASDVPATSPSSQLRQYPADLLASPLDQRSARLDVTAGTGVVSGEQADGATDSGVLYGLDRLTTAYTALVSRATLTPAFALLAVVLSMLLGALHAFAPGHGKTLMAAYLVGREGTWRQAAVIGMSVTLTHTIGVLLLGAALTAALLAAPESVYPWLGLVSGLLLAAIGVTLLRSPVRLLAGHTHGPDDGTGHGHGHGHRHGPEDGTGAGHGPDAGTGHGHGHGDGHGDPRPHRVEPVVTPALVHAGSDLSLTSKDVPPVGGTSSDVTQYGHGHLPDPATGGRWASLGGAGGTARLAAVGLVGGMVPSPSALLVLLGGIALGRTWFGALLVLAYGIGMAGALVGTGLLLVAARDRIEAWSVRRAELRTSTSRWTPLAGQVGRVLPRLTALVVIVVGLSLAARSALTL